MGQRVAALGAGPAPIPVERLNAEMLGMALGQVKRKQACRLRAATLGEKIRSEDGIGTTIRLIEEQV